MYLPAGTVFAEAVVGAATVVGYRLTVFASDDPQCTTRLEEIAADAAARGKDGSVQVAVANWLLSLSASGSAGAAAGAATGEASTAAGGTQA